MNEHHLSWKWANYLFSFFWSQIYRVLFVQKWLNTTKISSKNKICVTLNLNISLNGFTIINILKHSCNINYFKKNAKWKWNLSDSSIKSRSLKLYLYLATHPHKAKLDMKIVSINMGLLSESRTLYCILCTKPYKWTLDWTTWRIHDHISFRAVYTSVWLMI